MNNRSRVVLAVLFFAGLLALWLVPRLGIPTAEERRRRAGRVLPELIDVPVVEIERVEIDGGPEPLAFVRHGRRSWRMVAPRPGLADAARLESMLTQLKRLAPLPDAAPIPTADERHGLSPPERTVRLFRANAARPIATLDLGRVSGEARFVRPGPSGQSVEVVEARAVAPVLAGLDDWRERRLWPALPYDVTEVAVEGRGAPLSLSRGAEGWRITRPFQAPADAEAVGALLTDLLNLGAERFVPEPAAEPRPDPWLTITVRCTEGVQPPVTVRVGPAAPGRPGSYLADRGPDRLEVAGAPLESLRLDPVALRSKRPLGFEALRSAVLELVEPGTPPRVHRVVRGTTAWTVTRAEEGPADPRVVHDLLAGLDALTALAVLAPGAAPSPARDPDARLVKLWKEGRGTGPPDALLRIGRVDARRHRVLAQLDGDATILVLPEAAGTLLPSGPFAFRDRAILGLPPDRIATIRVEHDGRTVAVRSSGRPRDHEHWQMTEPVSAAVDPRAVAQLDLLLTGLRAADLVAEGTPPTSASAHGLDAPWATIAWTMLPGVPGSGRLKLGDLVPDGAGQRYAAVEGQERVFTLDPRAVAILTAELHDRTVLAFPAGQAQHLRFAWSSGRTWSLKREDRPFQDQPRWTTETGPAPVHLNDQHVAILITRLANLTTERFVQYAGPFPAGSGLDRPRFEIQIDLGGGLGSRRLRVGSAAGPNLVHATAETADAGSVVLLPESIFSGWLALAESRNAPELPENVFTRD